MDGNGRTCRAVMDFVLVSMKLPPAQFKEKEKVDVGILSSPTEEDIECTKRKISGVTGLGNLDDDEALVEWLKNDGNCANANELFNAAGNFNYNTAESWYCTDCSGQEAQCPMDEPGRDDAPRFGGYGFAIHNPKSSTD